MLVFFIFLTSGRFVAGSEKWKNCTRTYPNIRLDCAEPAREKVEVSIDDCRALCAEEKSEPLSCQHDSRSFICEFLKAASPLDDGFTEASDGDKRQYGVAKRHLSEGNKLSQNSRLRNSSHCDASLIPSIGYTFIAVDKNCSSRQATSKGFLTTDTEKLKIRKLANTHYAAAKIASGIKPVGSTVQNLTNLAQIESSSSKLEPPVRGRKKTKHSDCLPNYTLRFEVVQGIEILANPLISFHAESPDVCLYACKTNHANGTRLPTMCRSAQFSRSQLRCSFFENSITPSGSAQYEPNKELIYFEKVCLPEALSKNCKGSLRRVPQYVLIGHATAIVTAQTHSSCVEMCIRATVEMGFECRSAIHFHEFPALNCILNMQSARTRPNFFSAELKQKVDYIEMNDCQQKNLDSALLRPSLEGFIELAQETAARRDPFAASDGCNPLKVCCPLRLSNGLNDCTRGYRILKNGLKVDCLPEACS